MNTAVPGHDDDFIVGAEAFAQRYRGHAAFRLLRFYLRCSVEELETLAKFAYCACLPSNTIPIQESLARTVFGLVTMPAYYFLKKSWLWSPAAKTEFALETIDPPYFEAWFSRLYENLPGSKRLSPRSPELFDRSDLSLPCGASVCLGDLARLMFVAPLLAPALVALSMAVRLNLLKTCRQAVAAYTTYRGYFRRFPCRHFITFDDYPNHPARRIAFRQACDGELIAIQNGERGHLPQLAYGCADRYFLFGPKFIEIMKGLKADVGRYEPVGALCLNQRYGLYLEETSRGVPETRYDVLFVDQGVSPHNGTPAYYTEALLRILENLAKFHRLHPGVRLFYQLRHYDEASRFHQEAVLAMLNGRFPGVFGVLGNDGRGESYRNILHANLTVTFESTLGFEALMLGRKALFVNYSGNPGETMCSDERYQIEDPSADYGRFEEAVTRLLACEP